MDKFLAHKMETRRAACRDFLVIVVREGDANPCFVTKGQGLKRGLGRKKGCRDIRKIELGMGEVRQVRGFCRVDLVREGSPKKWEGHRNQNRGRGLNSKRRCRGGCAKGNPPGKMTRRSSMWAGTEEANRGKKSTGGEEGGTSAKGHVIKWANGGTRGKKRQRGGLLKRDYGLRDLKVRKEEDIYKKEKIKRGWLALRTWDMGGGRKEKGRLKKKQTLRKKGKKILKKSGTGMGRKS